MVVYRRKMTKTVIFQNLMDLSLYKRNIFILFFLKKQFIISCIATSNNLHVCKYNIMVLHMYIICSHSIESTV